MRRSSIPRFGRIAQPKFISFRGQIPADLWSNQAFSRSHLSGRDFGTISLRPGHRGRSREPLSLPEIEAERTFFLVPNQTEVFAVVSEHRAKEQSFPCRADARGDNNILARSICPKRQDRLWAMAVSGHQERFAPPRLSGGLRSGPLSPTIRPCKLLRQALGHVQCYGPRNTTRASTAFTP